MIEMAHSMSPAPSSAALVIPAKTSPLTGFQRVRAQLRQEPCQAFDSPLIKRRSLSLGLAGSLLSFDSVVDGGVANAASRRPPPPPPEEKNDPNVSGVQAKVLASKKRKEAMKQAVAKLREKGKPIDEPPSPSPPAEAQ